MPGHGPRIGKLSGAHGRKPNQVRLMAPERGDSTPESNDDRFEQALRYTTLIAPKLTIQGGTREVLRGIIARGLGLR